MGARSKDTPPKKRGPKPEMLKLEGPWEEAVSKALKKKRPEGGWPKAQKKGREK